VVVLCKELLAMPQYSTVFINCFFTRGIDGQRNNARKLLTTWLEMAVSLYEHADNDTRMQFKHIAIITQREADKMETGEAGKTKEKKLVF